MSSNYKILILVTALWLAACGPKHTISTEPARHEPGYELFSEAEKFFQTKSYDKALEKYNAYLVRFRDGSFADAALMKTGMIFTALGNNTEARNTYNRLLVEYPGSLFVSDAEFEILATLYREGNYEEVIKKADEVLKEKISTSHLIRIYDLLGDVYTAVNSPKDAVYFYIKAYCYSNELQKNKIIKKLKDPFGKLDTVAISSLLERLKDMPRGSFLFYMGVDKFEEEKFGEAMNLLSAFIKEFPEHDDVRQAKLMLEELYKKSVYSRYTIGCLLPLSGPYKIYGNRALKGVELALSQFSSRIANPALKIIVKDTESDPDKAASVVLDLYNQHVAAIIGPIIADEPAAVEAQNRGIPIITLTQKDHIPDIGNYVFRNFITPKMQVKSLVAYAVDTLELSRFAILYPEEKYGKTFMNLFWDEVIAYGKQVVGVESYESEQTDFADPIKKLVGLYYEIPDNLENETGQMVEEIFEPVADFDTFHPDSILNFEDFYFDTYEDLKVATQAFADPEEVHKDPEPIVDFDALFIPDASDKAGLVVPQLPFFDIGDVYLLGTNLWHADSLIEMARQYAQGAIMTDGFFAESNSVHVKNFVKLFKNIYGKQPGFIEAVAYDTAMIMLQTISQPEIFYRSGLRDALMNLNNYPGVTGLTSFDHNGEVQKKLYLLRIQGKKFVELESD